VFEYLAIFAATISAVGALYSIVTYKKQKDLLSNSYQKILNNYTKMLGIKSTASTLDLMRARSDLQKVLTGASEALSHISGKETHGSIKLIENDGQGENVVTFLRDISSAASREMFKLKYPVANNSAYSSILQNMNKENGHFLVNDLRKMSEGGYFHSGSDKNNWEPIYKSVLVLPIKGKDNNELLGFLTFDSKDKSAFSEDSVSFASSVSKLISAALLGVLSKDRSSSTSDDETSNHNI